jgi:phospholipid/cholesterol/gamma-HCH transport system substrate-binding protein
MRSRTIREGSVGLLILLGLGLFGVLFLWLRGFNPTARSYQFSIDFIDIGGMQVGAPVRYRGVIVGKVVDIRAGTNGVAVDVEIIPATLKIPRNALIQANQSGLIGETSVDIYPQGEPASIKPDSPQNSLLDDDLKVEPTSPDCPGSVIVCDGDRLVGDVGVNFNALIAATIRLSNLLADPAFFGEIRTLTRNSAEAAGGVAVLTRQVTRLTQSLEQDLKTLSASTNATTIAAGRAATAAERTVSQAGGAIDQVGLTAAELRLTSAQVNSILTENRSSISGTLTNINQTSEQLEIIVSSLTPVIQEGELLQNLETLSANAALASENFRMLSTSLNNTENLLMLQQTLESARATFQNAQKITADLDDLTGDPSFRQNIRELINGLSGLVSLTEQLQQQTEVAGTLTPNPAVSQAENSASEPPHALRSPLELTYGEMPGEVSREVPGESDAVE